MPWLALVSFEAGELTLQPKQVQSLTKITAARAAHVDAASSKTTRDPLAPSATGALSLTVNELLGLKSSGEIQVAYASATAAEERLPPDTMLQSIIMSRELAVTLLGDSDDEATSWSSAGKANIERYSHLAHLRHVNNTGLKVVSPDTANQDVVSTLICHRTGRPQLAGPVKMAVHVVSLDGVEGLDLKSGPDAISLISLHSWTYSCVPESHKSFRDSMQALIGNIAPLTYTKAQLDAALSSNSGEPSTEWLRQRLEAGHTMVRSVVQTGEPTLATVRGVLSPSRPLTQSRDPSSDGNNLQVLDREAGIMDLTYSTAWQLGRTTALAAPGFSQAVIRIRAGMHQTALTQAKKEVDLSFMTKAALVSELNRMGKEMSANLKSLKDLALNGRWKVAEALAGAPLREEVSWFNDALRKSFDRSLLELSGKLHGLHETDMQIVAQWVLEALRMTKLAPYNLVPDVRMVPHESIRTFYVDDAWNDAFIDGALAVGNHYDDGDLARSVIKKDLNEHLSRKDSNGVLVNQRQIPRWGMLIRSEQMMGSQEFVVSVRESTDTFISSTKLAEDLRMFLFSRYPEDPDFSRGNDPAIVISQPPHQQRFSLVSLSASTVECSIFGLKSTEAVASERYKHWKASWQATGSRNGVSDNIHDLAPIYNWNTRSLIPQQLSKACASLLRTRMAGSDLLTNSVQSSLSSAGLALQLNEAVFDVVVSTSECLGGATGSKATPTRVLPFAAEDRQAPRGGQGGTPASPPTPDTRAPVVKRSSVPFDVIKSGPGTLGPALTTQLIRDSFEASVWPVLTRGKAIPASSKKPIDLVFALSFINDHAFGPSTSITLVIPTGTAATDLFTQTADPPRVRMLSKLMRWKASVVVPDPVKRDSLRITIDTYHPVALAGADDLKGVPDINTHHGPSFILGPVGNITGKGTVQIGCTVSARTLDSGGGRTETSQSFAVVKEDVPNGQSWP